MIEVRDAEPGDGEAVGRLLDEAAAAIGDRRGGEPLLAERDTAAPIATLVGVLADAVVGVATLRLSGDRALLDTLWVTPQVREVGVGDALLDAAIERARGLGARSLDSFALPGDRDTKNFFESHAMTARLLVVHREL